MDFISGGNVTYAGEKKVIDDGFVLCHFLQLSLAQEPLGIFGNFLPYWIQFTSHFHINT
jgi:hypothetical protein